MASCCLCQCELSSAQAKKRRKKLHGSSCNESRLLLEKDVEKKFGLGLDAIVETDQDSFLCRLCNSKLLKISELRQKLADLESDLKKGIENFHFKARSGEKRQASPASTSFCSKRSRLESSSTITQQSPGVSVSM